MKLATRLQRLEPYLTPERAFIVLVAMGAVRLLVYILSLILDNPDMVLGGDFVAFWAAGRETLAGQMAALYAPDGMFKAISTHRPELTELSASLSWQYPPHSTLIFSPMGYLPFAHAYILWCICGIVAYSFALKQLNVPPKALIALLTSSVVYCAWLTGQNGLFTATLLMVAVLFMDKRPVMAGLAAAMLTVKPQLGLLLPIAYLAARAWVPLITASLASLILWGASALIAGPDVWFAFFGSVLNVGGLVETGLMPLFKMVNVFSTLRLAGLPTEFAGPASLALFMAVAGLIFWVWQRTQDLELRFASIGVCTLMVAPYAFFYELTFALPAVFIIAKRGYTSGWLTYERLTIAILILLSTLLPGPEIRSGISLAFVCLLITACLVFRRLIAELRAPSRFACSTITPKESLAV